MNDLFFRAITNQDVDKVKLLLQQGSVDANVSMQRTVLSKHWSALHYATIVGSLESVASIVKFGGNINAQDSTG